MENGEDNGWGQVGMKRGTSADGREAWTVEMVKLKDICPQRRKQEVRAKKEHEPRSEK